MFEISIIIPCRDEQENARIIAKNIQENCKYKNFEIVFINDFSQDKTEQVLIELSSKFKNISYFNNKQKGLGGAIKLGLKQSTGDLITIMMADSADSITDLNTYIDLMKSTKFDAIFGSRFIKGSEIVDYPKIKLIINRLGNYLTKFFFMSDYNDFSNSFKIYRKDIFNHINPIVSEDFNIFLELPLKTITRGFTYKIIPIKYYNRTVGTANSRLGTRF